jgi:phosphate transport system substrate-binding protein
MNVLTRRWHVRAGVVAMVAVTVLVGATSAWAKPTINGAGATAPQLLYEQWAHDYSAAKINYNGVGSGAGIAQITNGTVNFGASDKPLTRAVLDASPGLVQFPSCVEGIVPIVNIKGVASGRLKLSGAVLAKIYEGSITTWNNSAIKALNPGLKLPSAKIYTVHRSDSSGTTWIFTHYLQAIDPSGWHWADMSGSWPGSNTVGANKSAGVAAEVKSLKGAIGYVEYSYAATAHIPYAQMKNKTGKFVLPSLSTFTAAGAHAKYTWSNGFATSLVNMSGKTVWPITGETYILVRSSQGSYATGNAMLKFFNWGLTSAKGIKDARTLDFVPLPSTATKAIKAVWHSKVKAGSKPCW